MIERSRLNHFPLICRWLCVGLMVWVEMIPKVEEAILLVRGAAYLDAPPPFLLLSCCTIVCFESIVHQLKYDV